MRPRRIQAVSHVRVLCGLGALALLVVDPRVGLAVLVLGLLWFVRPRTVSTGPPSGAAPTLLAIFHPDEPVDALLPLAGSCGDGAPVEVVWIEEVPCQAPLWLLQEHDAQVLARLERASDANQVPCRFEGVLTRRGPKLLRQRAGASRWVVMTWRSRSWWRQAVDGLARFAARPPCNLVLYRAARGVGAESAELRPQRILVLAQDPPRDALLLELARRLARRQEGCRLTVCHVAPDADRTPPAPARSGEEHEVVRSTDLAHAVLQRSTRCDLVILGAGPLEDRIAARADCAVVQVQAGLRLPARATVDEPEREATP